MSLNINQSAHERVDELICFHFSVHNTRAIVQPAHGTLAIPVTSHSFALFTTAISMALHRFALVAFLTIIITARIPTFPTQLARNPLHNVVRLRRVAFYLLSAPAVTATRFLVAIRTLLAASVTLIRLTLNTHALSAAILLITLKTRAMTLA